MTSPTAPLKVGEPGVVGRLYDLLCRVCNRDQEVRAAIRQVDEAMRLCCSEKGCPCGCHKEDA